MTKITKFKIWAAIVLGSVAITLTIIGGVTAWKWAQDKINPIGPPAPSVLVAPGVVKAQAQDVTAAALGKVISVPIKAAMKSKKETPQAASETTYKLGTGVRKEQPSDHAYTPEKRPEQEQIFKKIMSKERDGESIPIAWAIYYPMLGNWKTGTYDLRLHVKTTESLDREGRTSLYTEAYLENSVDKDSRGVRYPLEVVSSNFYRLEPKEKGFFWLDPQLDLGAGYLAGSGVGLGVEVGASLSSYGKMKGASEWRFLKVGIAGNRDGGWATAAPVSWNMGNVLPVVKDLWITPGVGWAWGESSLSFSLNISTTL